MEHSLHMVACGSAAELEQNKCQRLKAPTLPLHRSMDWAQLGALAFRLSPIVVHTCAHMFANAHPDARCAWERVPRTKAVTRTTTWNMLSVTRGMMCLSHTYTRTHSEIRRRALPPQANTQKSGRVACLCRCGSLVPALACGERRVHPSLRHLRGCCQWR